MRHLILKRDIKTQTVYVEFYGNVHSAVLNPNIEYEERNGINIIRYGSIDFPDEPMWLPNNERDYYPIVEAFSRDLAEILHQALPKTGKVLVRGVYSGDLEKTIENQTDRWDTKSAFASFFEGNPRQYTFAWPSPDSSVDSLLRALNPGKDHTAVGPVYRLLGGRLVRINPHSMYFFKANGDINPDLRKDFDRMLIEEAERTTMILVFDGSNAAVVPGKSEGYGPYRFEGEPHLLAIAQFDLNYPRSFKRIDREFLFKGLDEYRQWWQVEGEWKISEYDLGKRYPVRFKLTGKGLSWSYDYRSKKDAGWVDYVMGFLPKELAMRQQVVRDCIRTIK